MRNGWLVVFPYRDFIAYQVGTSRFVFFMIDQLAFIQDHFHVDITLFSAHERSQNVWVSQYIGLDFYGFLRGADLVYDRLLARDAWGKTDCIGGFLREVRCLRGG